VPVREIVQAAETAARVQRRLERLIAEDRRAA
jgi:hypothetical protein